MLLILNLVTEISIAHGQLKEPPASKNESVCKVILAYFNDQSRKSFKERVEALYPKDAAECNIARSKLSKRMKSYMYCPPTPTGTEVYVREYADLGDGHIFVKKCIMALDKIDGTRLLFGPYKPDDFSN